MITRIRLGHTHLSRSVEPGPPKDPPQPTPPPPPAWRRWLIPLGMLILILLLFWPSFLRSHPTTKYTFTTFQSQVTSGDVKSVTIDSNGAVTGVLTNGKDFTSLIPTVLNRAPITQDLTAHHVQITATQAGGQVEHGPVRRGGARLAGRATLDPSHGGGGVGAATERRGSALGHDPPVRDHRHAVAPGVAIGQQQLHRALGLREAVQGGGAGGIHGEDGGGFRALAEAGEA